MSNYDMSLNIYTNPISKDAMSAYLKWKHKEHFDFLESLDLEDLEKFMADFTYLADPAELNIEEVRLIELLKEKYEEIKRSLNNV